MMSKKFGPGHPAFLLSNICLYCYEGFFLALAQRAWTALRPCSLSCSFVSLRARALPPLRPSAAAALFFAIAAFYQNCCIFLLTIRSATYSLSFSVRRAAPDVTSTERALTKVAYEEATWLP